MSTCYYGAVLAALLLGHSSAAVFDVTTYGATGDGTTVDSAAVRAAAAACAIAGGGTLLFPANTDLSTDPKRSYVTGAFNLSSNMHVEIEEGVHLLGSHSYDGSDWPLVVVEQVWPGFGYARDSGPPHASIYTESGRLMHQSLLFTWNSTNVSVGGGGTIDCRGDHFQGCSSNLTKPPCSGYARPQCVFFSNSTGVVFEDVTVLNSPDWTLHFSSVDNLRVRRVNVTQPGGGNRDGIDIDSCRDVVVEDSFLAAGDDTIAVKSGIDYFGRRYNRPSRDILFRNITTGGGYGITIGSEVSGGISNVTFENITVHHQTAGIHIKAPSGRGAYITNITYRNIHLVNVRQCILIGVGGGHPENSTGPPSSSSSSSYSYSSTSPTPPPSHHPSPYLTGLTNVSNISD
jgi:polygalacturonase